MTFNCFIEVVLLVVGEVSYKVVLLDKVLNKIIVLKMVSGIVD